MSPLEIAWRVRSKVRDTVDRPLVGVRSRPRPIDAILHRNGSAFPSIRLVDFAPGEWASEKLGDSEKHWQGELMAKADKIVDHRLSFFDLVDHPLGHPIQWNRDHKAGIDCPLKFAAAIDYRDHHEVGDCKFVWEPSRHHQFVVLALAYRATGKVFYAQALVEQLDSWLHQCPFGLGMQWRSPLELGIRLINWVWAMDLIWDSGVVHDALRSRWMNSLYLHVWDVSRKFSKGSSANNHLIGEAAGVFIATSYLKQMNNASRWRCESRDILAREIGEQTYPDGLTREQALGYHLFVIQFYTLAGIVARKCGEDFDSVYWARLEKMYEAIGRLSEGGDELPLYGDADDGYVIDLGGHPRDVRVWMAIGAVLFQRPDFKAWSGGYAEQAGWLLGESSRCTFDQIPDPPKDSPITSHGFEGAGYYLLQHGIQNSLERISVLFDCGELGYKSIAAHGHADALSFTLRAFGRDVLVDPGTYDYFTYPEWRNYFRSTRAHNTIEIDGQDQSALLGAFMWGSRATAHCTHWSPNPSGGSVAGEHDGYARLDDPVNHRRSLNLTGDRRELTVTDEINANGRHELAVYWHFSRNCGIQSIENNNIVIDVDSAGEVVLECDSRWTLEQIKGNKDTMAGWVSRGYHRREAGTTLIGRWTSSGNAEITTRIRIGKPK
jgi:hypothetical protein